MKGSHPTRNLVSVWYMYLWDSVVIVVAAGNGGVDGDVHVLAERDSEGDAVEVAAESAVRDRQDVEPDQKKRENGGADAEAERNGHAAHDPRATLLALDVGLSETL